MKLLILLIFFFSCDHLNHNRKIASRKVFPKANSSQDLKELYDSNIQECDSLNIETIVQSLKDEIKRDSVSLNFERYRELDDIIFCDYHKKLKEKDKKNLIKTLAKVKNNKPTPFVWAESDKISWWDSNEVIRNNSPINIKKELPIKLSQLNSSVVAFVPDLKNGQTNYNFKSDLDHRIFSPWDRRNTGLIPNEDLEIMNEYLSQPRVSNDYISNFTRNFSAIEVSKIGFPLNDTCYYYTSSKTIKCDNGVNTGIVHEIFHLLETRLPKFISLLHNANGGYLDRLKQAQQIVPSFGVTQCTLDSWEEFCVDGPVNQEETLKIVKATKPPQDYGSNAGRFYARPMDEHRFCNDLILKHKEVEYCIDRSRESLYTYVRGGEEYISVLLEKGLIDHEQFSFVASDEEKRLFELLKEYIF